MPRVGRQRRAGQAGQVASQAGGNRGWRPLRPGRRRPAPCQFEQQRLFDRLGLKLDGRDAPPQRQGRRCGRSLRAAAPERSPHGAQRGDHLGLPAPDAGRGLPQETLVERTPRQADPAAEEQQVDVGAAWSAAPGRPPARPGRGRRAATSARTGLPCGCRRRRRGARVRRLRQRAFSGDVFTALIRCAGSPGSGLRAPGRSACRCGRPRYRCRSGSAVVPGFRRCCGHARRLPHDPPRFEKRRAYPHAGRACLPVERYAGPHPAVDEK